MMLPNGWKKVKLGDVVKMSSGGTPSKDNASFWNGNIPWISALEMHKNYVEEAKLNITEEALKKGSSLAKKNDLLLLTRGSMLWKRIPVCLCLRDVAFNQDVKCLHTNERLNSTFLLYWFGCVEPKIMHMVVGTGIGAGKLESGGILDLDVDLPPVEEQKKIAAALSVWDSAIEKMEKLIEAKESQKKSLIKKLIEKQEEKANKIKVGNVTIDKNKWKHERIGNVLKIGHGRDYKGLSLGNVPVFGSGGYMTSVDNFLHDGETVCIGRKGTIDNPFYYKGKIWTVDTLFYTYDFKNVIPKFIYYVFCSIPWKIKNEAGGVPSLTSKIVENVEFYKPSLPEQQIIVDVLSNADEEISLLKQQLENYKKQKQGLMQKLFTGQWRVK